MTEFIIIDELLHGLINLPLDPMPYEALHPEEHGMVKKNGKLVKRHHPIPKTPRSPRQSKKR